MDGIFEEAPLAELDRLERLDPVVSAELGFDVVYAVQTGRDLIDSSDGECLGDCTEAWSPGELACWAYLVLIPMLSFASGIALAVWWLT